MSFLNKFFSERASKPLPPLPPEVKGSHTNLEVAMDPVLFADWVNEYIVLGLSFEQDLGMAPDEEQSKRLQISKEEKILCANECVLLRALGACLFVRNFLDEKLLGFDTNSSPDRSFVLSIEGIEKGGTQYPVPEVRFRKGSTWSLFSLP